MSMDLQPNLLVNYMSLTYLSVMVFNLMPCTNRFV